MGAQFLGWKLLCKTKDSVVIQEGFPTLSADKELENDFASGLHTFELLEELPFSSSRQRMTVICRDTWNNKICLYSKGADSKIVSLSCDADCMTRYVVSE